MKTTQTPSAPKTETDERQLQALLQGTAQAEGPAFVDHRDEQAVIAPRDRLREYLRELAEALGESLPETWPEVPPATFEHLYKRLESSCERLYEYLERQDIPPKQKRDQKMSLRLIGESAQQLLKLDWTRPQGWAQASTASLDLLCRRPRPKISLDQLYCTPDSTERRALAALQGLGRPDGKLLCLGDDDLCSLVLAAHSGPETEIHAVDFDQRLLDHITATEPSIQAHHCDLVKGGLPADFVGAFDAVLLDPPWDDYGAWSFLDKAILALKPDLQSRLYLSFCPLYIEHVDCKMTHFWRRLTRRGLTCERLDPGFHLYGLEGTEFARLLQHQLPTLESPLFDCLRRVPYGFSHLYILRRLTYAPKDHIGDAWRRWWHVA